MATVYCEGPSGNSNLRVVFSSGAQYLRSGNGVLENFATVADYRVAAAGSDALTDALARYRFTVPTPAVLPVSLNFCIHDITTSEIVGVGIIDLDEDGNEITWRDVADLIRADRYIDKTTDADHWALVLIRKGSGGLGEDGSVELLRQLLYDLDGAALASSITPRGRSVSDD